MERLENSQLGETLYAETLKSGLRVCVLPRPGFAKTYATFATRYGSIDSRFIVPGETEELVVPEGIAHFLEHKLFEKEWGSAFDRFAELGADTNAYTSWNTTTYLFSATDNFEACLDLLADFVLEPYFTDESVEKEKGIIEQEIRMYRDDPNWRVLMNLLAGMYHRHPVRIDIAGSVESIRQIDKDTLFRCYRTFYHPSNMVFFVAGAVDPSAVIARVAGRVNARGFKPQDEIRRVMPEEPDSVLEARVEDRLSISQPVVRLGFKDPDAGYGGLPLLRKEILTDLALDILIGRASSLYLSLYEEGLVDTRFSASFDGELTYGHTVMGGESRDPERLIARLLQGIEDFRRRGVDTGDFERIRKKSIGRALRLFNAPESLAYVFNSGYFNGWGLFDHLSVLESITLDEVDRRVREHFDPGQHVVSVVYPK